MQNGVYFNVYIIPIEIAKFKIIVLLTNITKYIIISISKHNVARNKIMGGIMRKKQLRSTIAVTLATAGLFGFAGCNNNDLNLSLDNCQKLKSVFEEKTEKYLKIDEETFYKIIDWTNAGYFEGYSTEELKEQARTVRSLSVMAVRKHLYSALVGMSEYHLTEKSIHSYGYDEAYLGGTTEKSEKVHIDIYGNLESFVNYAGDFEYKNDSKEQIIDNTTELAKKALLVLLSSYKLDKNRNLIEKPFDINIMNDSYKLKNFYEPTVRYNIFGEEIKDDQER